MKLFKQFGEKLGLPLRPTEREELIAFDKLSSSAKNFRERGDIVNAYALIEATQDAINTAKDSIVQDKWLEALRLAREADKIIQPLIEHKLFDILSPEMDGFIPIILLSAICFQPVTRRVFNMTSEESMIAHEYINTLFFLPFVLMGIMGGLNQVFSSQLACLLTTSMTEHVLDVAEKAHVTIDCSQIPSAPIVIKERNNAQILEKVGATNVPDRFRCTINMDVMTNPTFSKISTLGDTLTVRFEKKCINNWFKIRNTHPTETTPLYRENLSDDLSLKQEINAYVDQEVDEFEERKQYINTDILQPLIRNSVFKYLTEIMPEEEPTLIKSSSL